jgi:hypothetical protein
VSAVAIRAKRLELASFLSEQGRKGEYVAGTLTAEGDFASRGANPADWIGNLTGQGKVIVEQGALRNRNLLRENLERITQIPGVGLLFRIDLGPRFDALLRSPDTSFDRLTAAVRVQASRVYFDSLTLTHPDYGIQLEGWYGLDQTIDARGTLLVRSDLSSAMVGKVKELIYLSDPQGQVVIPFVFQGSFPGAQVRPNIGDLAAKTLTNVGMDLIDQGIKSVLEKLGESKEAAGL